MPRFLPHLLAFATLLSACAAIEVDAGRYGGYRYVRPRIIENVFVPPRVAPPPAPPSVVSPQVAAPPERGALKPPSELTAEDAARKTLQAMSPPNQSEETTLPGHIGKWTASVGTHIRVWVTLNEDGTFLWSVINDSRRNGFRGTYTLENGELTLRREDGNSLKLSLTELDVGFNLRAVNAQDAGLDFRPR